MRGNEAPGKAGTILLYELVIRYLSHHLVESELICTFIDTAASYYAFLLVKQLNQPRSHSKEQVLFTF